jgi:hypothetical protein
MGSSFCLNGYIIIKKSKNLCIFCKFFLRQGEYGITIMYKRPSVKTKCGGKCRRICILLLAERLAVGALVHGGVCLVGTHGNAIQGTVVGIVTMVSALLDGAFDTLVGMTAHT